MVLALNKHLFHSFINLINQDSSVNEVTDHGLDKICAFPYGWGCLSPPSGSVHLMFISLSVTSRCDSNAKGRRVQSVTVIVQ
jgi:hypothetical protein